MEEASNEGGREEQGNLPITTVKNVQHMCKNRQEKPALI